MRIRLTKNRIPYEDTEVLRAFVNATDALDRPLAQEAMLELCRRARADKDDDKHDAEVERLWDALADVPMNPETEKIESPFLHFPAGTDREEIWHWFDEHHSKGVAWLLYETWRQC